MNIFIFKANFVEIFAKIVIFIKYLRVSIIGLPDFDIPSLDPFYTESYSMEHESGQLRGKMLVTDARLYGLAKSRFLSVKPEMDGDFFRLEIDVEIPKILIDGDYKAEGSLGTFKMGGKGMCEQ